MDDNAFNLIPLEMLLDRQGIKCDKALGGQEAIDKFIKSREKTCCERKYQIVLMDLNMPNVDGFMATQKILAFQKAHFDKKMKLAANLNGAKNEAPPAVVAAVTAYVNDDTLTQCYNVGMVEVHSKPVDSKTLSIFISKYYKQEH